eukprot:10867959-Ditylum_brightwellii.AAC.1
MKTLTTTSLQNYWSETAMMKMKIVTTMTMTRPTPPAPTKKTTMIAIKTLPPQECGLTTTAITIVRTRTLKITTQFKMPPRSIRIQ